MDKVLAFLLIVAFAMLLHALQADEQIALRALFQVKHAVNRAAHAAAQQIDAEKLKDGIISIDSDSAAAAARHYLQRNMRLDDTMEPLPGSFWRSRLEVIVFEVINEDRAFPYVYTYVNGTEIYNVTLERPGVVMLVRMEYPRTYKVLGPITWEIKGAAELVF